MSCRIKLRYVDNKQGCDGVVNMCRYLKLPMDRKSTQHNSPIKASKCRKDVEALPDKRTIEFIRMFARGYHCEPTLARGLQDMVLN